MVLRIPLLLTAALSLLVAGAAFAEPDSTGQPANGNPPGRVRKAPPGMTKFEPAPESEQVDAANLVVLAYGAVFVGLFGYVLFIARSQSEMSREMAELAARVKRVERP